MHLLAPGYLHLLWLALIPLALWLYRRRARAHLVSTLIFFRTLAREHTETAWLRRLKHWLSLAMTLLILIAAIIALARPAREGAAEGGLRAIVVMLDTSASMAAVDARGESRITLAKKRVRDRIAALPDSTILSLVTTDPQPRVLLSRSRNHREFIRVLEDVESQPVQDDASAAMAVAERLAALDAPSQIWHLSDAALPEAVRAAEAARYQFTSVALDKPQNLGITAFDIRPQPLSRDRFEAFVRITASANNASQLTATLHGRISGRTTLLRELALKPGESLPLLLPLEGAHHELLELQLDCPGDELGWDNAVAAPIPEATPVIVAWFSDPADPYTDLALQSLIRPGRLEVYKGTPAAWPPKEPPQCYIFEHWLPAQLPLNRPCLVLNPSTSSGPVQVKPLPSAVPTHSVRVLDPEHPVLHRIPATRLSLAQTSSVLSSGPLQALWMAGNEPLLLAGEQNGQRLVLSTFAPDRSEQLPLTPAYPLLIANAIDWLTSVSETAEDQRPRHPGELLTLIEGKPGPVLWQAWDGKAFTHLEDTPSGALYPVQHLGAWTLPDGRTGSSSLASLHETQLPKLDTAAAASSPRFEAFTSGLAMSWPRMLLWCVLALLLIESWLFHRKTVY